MSSSAVSAWKPSDFAVKEDRKAESVYLDRLKPKPEVLESVATVKVDDLVLSSERDRLRQWEEELLAREDEIERLKKEVFDKAEEEGLKAGYREGWESAQDERKLLVNISQRLSDEMVALKSKLAPSVLELAVHAARHVVHESCSLHVKSAYQAINSVIESYDLSAHALQIKAHSKTIASIRSHDPKEKVFANCKFVEDNSLELGGFLIEHADGLLDCSIETRWDRAMRQLHGSPYEIHPESKRISAKVSGEGKV